MEEKEGKHTSWGAAGLGIEARRLFARSVCRWSDFACSHNLISHRVFLKSSCKSQFLRKSVNLMFIFEIVKDPWPDLKGS